MKLSHSYIIKFLLICVLIGANNLFAQRIKVPIDVQLKVIPKIISLNKKFTFQDNNKSLNMAVLYSSEQRSSKQVKEDLEKYLEETKMVVRGKVMNITTIDISSTNNIEEFFINNKINVLYICPLRGVDISKLVSICKDENVLSITGVVDYIENDVAVILDIDDSKLKILINQESAKSAGVDFSSRLLRIAKIID